MKNKKLIYDLDSDIPSNIGGKARGLKWLYDNGFNIPYTCVATTFVDSTEFERQVENLVSEVLLKNKLLGSKIAVRSSGITEDGENESKAGNYKTELSVDFSRNSIREAVKKVIKSGSDCEEQMGIVFQKMVNADISGVIFTSNPQTYSKKECIIEYTQGLGDRLVSGKDKGYKKIINKEEILETQEPWLKELCKLGFVAEKKYGRPLDIEFSVEKESNTIYFLQCRPITGIFFKENTIKPVSNSELREDKRICSLDKVSLRLDAERYNIMISNAFVVNVNCTTNEFPISKVNIKRSKYCKGYNVVVILPRLTDYKIMRYFAGDKANATKCITCNRYGIRAYPEHGDVLETLKALYKKVKDSSWICTMIIQEIFDPIYTGILRRNEDYFLLEVLRGHFAAKGINPMSSYIIDKKGNVKKKKEVTQEKFIRLIEGCIIDEHWGKKIILSNNEISLIVKTFSTYLSLDSHKNLEIGILKEGTEIIPYLIDITDDQKHIDVSEIDIIDGVISSGKGKGTLVKLKSENLESSIDSHLKDLPKELDNNRKEIYFCDIPDIALKNRLSKNCAGFLFKEGPMLCHLSVLLREKGIPAIVGVDENLLEEGKHYEIDTTINGNWENKVRQI